MADEPKLSAEEKRWQAQSDARTLADAEAIKKDAKRLKAAQDAATEMEEAAKSEAENLSAVAKWKKTQAKE